jgi:hypothetical protein
MVISRLCLLPERGVYGKGRRGDFSHLIVVPLLIFRFVDRFNLAANNRSLSPIAVHFTVARSYWSTGQ